MRTTVTAAILALTAALAIPNVALADTEIRTIAVNGTGSVDIKPDRATLTMSINVREATVAAAQQQAGAVTQKVLALTDRLKIDRKYVDTTAASVSPDYRWNREKEEQELRGYIANREMTIDVRNLDQLGQLIEGGVSAGVNQVSPPQLDSSKRRDAYRDALAAAAEDARANAARLATALGVKLGPVMQINAGNNTPPPMPLQKVMRAEAMMADGAEESYNPGQLSFQTNISVVFELVD